MRIDTQSPLNTGVIHYLTGRPNEERKPPIAAPDSAGKDPYWELGSHPEIVERIWDQIGKALPVDCRCLLYGTPALVTPVSGIVLAVAIGTSYSLRLPALILPVAIRLGAKTIAHWTSGGHLDVAMEFGTNWVFGFWAKDEPKWCVSMYESVEQDTKIE